MDADFNALSELSEDELRELLEEGEPRDRVRAAWILGMRLGRDVRGTISEAIMDEPTPGVRRHWAVMLAGFGDAKAVGALARHDPDAFVRATACQYVGELRREQAGLRDVLDACQSDPDPRVRRAVVAHAPPRDADLLEEGLRDVDETVRATAASRLLDLGSHFPDALRRALRDEENAAIRRRWMMEWLKRGGADEFLAGMRALDFEHADQALDVLAEQGASLSWEKLAPLARSAGPNAMMTVLAVLEDQPLNGSARTWLLAGVLRSLNWGAGLGRRDGALIVLARQYERHPEDIDPEETRLIFQVRKALRSFLGLLEEEKPRGSGELVEYRADAALKEYALRPEKRLGRALDGILMHEGQG